MPSLIRSLNKYLFGHTLGKFVNVFMLVVLLGVTSVMLSGAGAIFEEQARLFKPSGDDCDDCLESVCHDEGR